MQHGFFVDWSMFFIPWEDEAFSSIEEFLGKLWTYFSPRPTGDNTFFFLVLILVVVISTDYNDNSVTWSKENKRLVKK